MDFLELTQDRQYLCQPRNYPDPCFICGGRLIHSEACRELKRAWLPTIPFGKFKGKRICDVRLDYLEWLVDRPGLSSELKAAIESYLAQPF